MLQLAEKLDASLAQLVVAWAIRNNTSQASIVSANSADQLCLLLNSLQVPSIVNCYSVTTDYSTTVWVQLVPKLSNAIMDDIDRLLSNKPSRPPMVSTLQQRWAATGGMPPQ